MAQAFAPVRSDGSRRAVPAGRSRGEEQRWAVQGDAPTAPVFGGSPGAASAVAEEGILAAGTALPSLSARFNFPLRTHFCHCPPARSPPGRPHLCHAAGTRTLEAAPAEDYRLELQQSLCRRQTFNPGESILLGLCTAATPVTSSLGFFLLVPPLAHLWGTAFAPAGARRAHGHSGAARGDTGAPGAEPAGLRGERASGSQEPDSGI